MASLVQDVSVAVPAGRAWAALREVGQAHKLFADVLVDGRSDGDIRTVTFAGGQVVTEQIVDVDEGRMRVAYYVVEGGFSHHSASMQIVPEGEQRCRFVWISDFLPNEASAMVEPLMEAGAQALKHNLEAAA